ncbi:dihydrofolate reductase family protein [Dactylosporangium fulvum]|uniref:Dihydrofolate reductase family protein n=1 Tax=Dactylosporangium fulvum TaxID=53359 RepID=A0ABY5VPW3_9ACTN|nr:dihydrofolate reductase family protein [Dactylosporangium fulvum]UWP78841.1 dihydrofolate reductase family protein [Dactylosporangium fulvum]
MRKLLVTSFMTLDGVVQAPGGPDEDRDGGFTHGGWVVPHFDDQLGTVMTELVRRAGALLLGRRTYDIFAESWPLAPADDPIGSRLNALPKYVASRSLGAVPWQHSELLGGDAVAAVRELKQGDGGEIQVHGSAGLVQTLLRHDLVDALHLAVFPVLVGTGKRLFGDGTVPAGLRLTATATTGTGVVLTTYERAGRVEYGAMGPETGNW